LLLLALAEGLIDAAVILGMDEKDPLLTHVVVARTPEDILAGMGSKYTSGPINSCISEILKDDGAFAVVGLPCHIAALRKAEHINSKLKEKIVFHFGLFCQTRISYEGLIFWLELNKINPQKVTSISYRGRGWPGSMVIKTKNGETHFFPLNLSWGILENFSPKRCTLCTDALSELADVSFGDAWLPEFADDKIGTSIVIVRSMIGDELLKLAANRNCVNLKEATTDQLFRSQRVVLEFKKEQYVSRARFLSMLRKKVPKYTGGYIQNSHFSLTTPLMFYFQRWIFQNRTFWPILHYIIKRRISKETKPNS
jgi:coenzyme F420 hydrogenase subunit beta